MSFTATLTDLFFLNLIGFVLTSFWLARIAGKQR